MAETTNKLYLPVIAIIIWLATMAFGFWWFEYRYWQTFMGSNITFDGVVLESLYDKIKADDNDESKVAVIHFTDSSCPCSRYSREHISNLQPVLVSSQQYEVSPQDKLVIGISIPATPSVAVWDEQGKLAYFGPYSSGAVCGRGTDFVTRVISELKQKNNPEWINMVGVGCYCPWQALEEYNV